MRSALLRAQVGQLQGVARSSAEVPNPAWIWGSRLSLAQGHASSVAGRSEGQFVGVCSLGAQVTADRGGGLDFAWPLVLAPRSGGFGRGPSLPCFLVERHVPSQCE